MYIIAKEFTRIILLASAEAKELYEFLKLMYVKMVNFLSSLIYFSILN